MSDIDNERLAKFEGKCWHETTNEYPFKCGTCGQSETDWQGWFICPHNPDYSTSPDDRERLWGYLMGKEEMWIAFEVWIYTRKDSSRPHIPWLHKPLDGVPRWVGLLSEFLGMEETRERFGTIRCPQYTPDTDELVRGICTFIECSKRNAQCVTTGKIRAEWAKEE